MNYSLLKKRLTFLPAGREDGNSHWTIQNSFHHDYHISPCVFFSSIHTIYNINFMEKIFQWMLSEIKSIYTFNFWWCTIMKYWTSSK